MQEVEVPEEVEVRGEVEGQDMMEGGEGEEEGVQGLFETHLNLEEEGVGEEVLVVPEQHLQEIGV